jgi:NMD protein affecting ribosome stability and mRNA decay
MNDHWDCPSCGRPTPPEIDVLCHCGIMASHHVSVWTLCKRLRECQQRESALIVENNEQARLLGMSGERECDLRGKLEREREQRDRALTKIENQAVRIKCLEGATNHATGTPLSKMREQRDRLAEALKEIYNVSSFDYDTMPELARKKYREVVLEMADEALPSLTLNAKP